MKYKSRKYKVYIKEKEAEFGNICYAFLNTQGHHNTIPKFSMINTVLLGWLLLSLVHCCD